MKFSMDRLLTLSGKRGQPAETAEPAPKRARTDEGAPAEAGAELALVEPVAPAAERRRRRRTAEAAQRPPAQADSAMVTESEVVALARSAAEAARPVLIALEASGSEGEEAAREVTPAPGVRVDTPPIPRPASQVQPTSEAASAGEAQGRDYRRVPFHLAPNVSLMKDAALAERMMDFSVQSCDRRDGKGRLLGEVVTAMFANLYTQGREMLLIRDYCRHWARRDREQSAELASLKAEMGQKDAEVQEANKKIKALRAEASDRAKAKKELENELERERARVQGLRAELEAERAKTASAEAGIASAEARAVSAEKKASELEERAALARRSAQTAERATTAAVRQVERLQKQLDEAQAQRAEAVEKAGAEAVAAFKETPEYVADFEEAATDSFFKGIEYCQSQLQGVLPPEQLAALRPSGATAASPEAAATTSEATERGADPAEAGSIPPPQPETVAPAEVEEGSRRPGKEAAP